MIFLKRDSLHARLNSHFEAWSYKKRSTKRLQHTENYCMGFYYHLQMKKIKHLESFQQNNLWFWIIYYFLIMRIIVFFSVWHYEKNFALVIYVNFTTPYIRNFREYTSWRHFKFWTPNSIQLSLRNLRDFEYNHNWVNCNLKHSNSFVTADYIWPITYVESLSVNFFIWISKVRLKKRYIQLPMYSIDEQSITSGLRVFSCGQTAGFNTCKLKSEYQKEFHHWQKHQWRYCTFWSQEKGLCVQNVLLFSEINQIMLSHIFILTYELTVNKRFNMVF